MEDEIIYVPWSNRNLEKSRRLGFELFLDWQMTEALRTGFLYEYVRTTIEAEDFAGSKIPGSRSITKAFPRIESD